MSEARRMIDAVVAAVIAGNELPFDFNEIHCCLEDLYHDEGLEWKSTPAEPGFVYSDAWDDQLFDYFVEFFPNEIEEKRRKAIEAGAEPTEAEIQRWLEAFTEDFLKDPDWQGLYEFHPIRCSDGREVVVLLRKTGGGWDYDENIEGVYRTRDAAMQAVTQRDHTILEEWC